MIEASGSAIGEYNIEGFFTPEGRFFIVEINPRQAGHYNPQDIQDYCGVNLTRLLITTAVGDLSYYEELKHFQRAHNNILSYSVFSFKDGVPDHIHIDDNLSSGIIHYRYLHGQKEGDRVQEIVSAIRPIAKIVFQFETENELESIREKIPELVYAVLK